MVAATTGGMTRFTTDCGAATTGGMAAGVMLVEADGGVAVAAAGKTGTKCVGFTMTGKFAWINPGECVLLLFIFMLDKLLGATRIVGDCCGIWGRGAE